MAQIYTYSKSIRLPTEQLTEFAEFPAILDSLLSTLQSLILSSEVPFSDKWLMLVCYFKFCNLIGSFCAYLSFVRTYYRMARKFYKEFNFMVLRLVVEL